MRRECRERFPRHRLQMKPLVSEPDMHHGTCVTHVPWCMSGSFTRARGENIADIPGACATRDFTYLAKGLMACLFRHPLELLQKSVGKIKLGTITRCFVKDLSSTSGQLLRFRPGTDWIGAGICCPVISWQLAVLRNQGVILESAFVAKKECASWEPSQYRDTASLRFIMGIPKLIRGCIRSEQRPLCFRVYGIVMSWTGATAIIQVNPSCATPVSYIAETATLSFMWLQYRQGSGT